MTRRSGRDSRTPGVIVLFGSGELTPTGRKIHEDVFRRVSLSAPVKIGILETPTGFEVNAMHGWPERMEDFFREHLRDWKPDIVRIPAWRRDGEKSTNTPSTVDVIREIDYLYSGAGSPSYVITHLRDTLAWKRMMEAHARGATLCLGSATAVAIGRVALPVYEIYKAGEDIHWIEGLDILKPYGISIAVIPHWNNTEGEDFDTTRCWMGMKRFETLRRMLPPNITILGIDETTACCIDSAKNTFEVLGTGSAHIIRHDMPERTVNAGESHTLDGLR